MRASHPASCCSWPSRLARLWEGAVGVFPPRGTPPRKAFAPLQPHSFAGYFFPRGLSCRAPPPHTGVSPGLLLVPIEPGDALCATAAPAAPRCCWGVAAPSEDSSTLGRCSMAGLKPQPAAGAELHRCWGRHRQSGEQNWSHLCAPKAGHSRAGFGANPAAGSPQTSAAAIRRAAPWRRAFIFVEP